MITIEIFERGSSPHQGTSSRLTYRPIPESATILPVRGLEKPMK
jgi:hypothetical protein